MISLAKSNAQHPFEQYIRPPSVTKQLQQLQINTAAKKKISDSERLETASRLTEFDENPNL